LEGQGQDGTLSKAGTDMGNRLAGKVAIVTGAGNGIGRAEALALTSAGASIVVNDLGGWIDGSGSSSAAADNVVVEIVKNGGRAVANYDSVANSKSADNIIQCAMDNYGRLDILVNNAGILRDRFIYNMTDEEWDDVIRVHLYGTFYCTRAACRIFKPQRWGRIINTSSLSGMGMMGQPNYSAAKEGIVGFTRTVAIEMAKYGVTCNAIRPQATTRMLTPELRAEWLRKLQSLGATPEQIEALEKEIAHLTPEKIAPFVAYLASEDAAYINGRTFHLKANEIGIYSEPTVVKQMNKNVGLWTLDDLINSVPEKLFDRPKQISIIQ
jgi:NAD(P)-dependent dehydrogenase (short-subunit alcohol dehydrogenase family)